MRNLGSTGVKVSALCLGGNPFSWALDEKGSHAVLDAFVEGGGTFIDTADTYSNWAPGNVGGESEQMIGDWTKTRGNRADVFIATKTGDPLGEGANDKGLARRRIVANVEKSLRRLQTDYIDLFYAHRDDPDTPLEETMRAFDDLVSQGKVRYIGASNYSAWRLTAALWASDTHDYHRFAVLQPKYNLYDRADVEQDLERACVQFGVGIVPYYGLASGFLTGKYRKGQAAPQSVRAGGVQSAYMNDRGWRILDALDEVSASVNATQAQVALAWLLQRPGVTAPIASATTPEQVKELLGATEVKLDQAAVEKLDTASAWK